MPCMSGDVSKRKAVSHYVVLQSINTVYMYYNAITLDEGLQYLFELWSVVADYAILLGSDTFFAENFTISKKENHYLLV